MFSLHVDLRLLALVDLAFFRQHAPWRRPATQADRPPPRLSPFLQEEPFLQLASADLYL